MHRAVLFETNPICHPNNQKMRNEPNSSIPSVPPHTNECETNPISTPRAYCLLPRASIIRNEPNFRPGGPAKGQKKRNEPNLSPGNYAKRTQLPHVSDFPTTQIRETNPIPAPHGRKMRNQPNYRLAPIPPRWPKASPGAPGNPISSGQPPTANSYFYETNPISA